MPTPKSKPHGRPPEGRLKITVSFSRKGLDGIDARRGKTPRGKYLDKLVLAQPLSPFYKFRLLEKKS